MAAVMEKLRALGGVIAKQLVPTIRALMESINQYDKHIKEKKYVESAAIQDSALVKHMTEAQKRVTDVQEQVTEVQKRVTDVQKQGQGELVARIDGLIKDIGELNSRLSNAETEKGAMAKAHSQELNQKELTHKSATNILKEQLGLLDEEKKRLDGVIKQLEDEKQTLQRSHSDEVQRTHREHRDQVDALNHKLTDHNQQLLLKSHELDSTQKLHDIERQRLHDQIAGHSMLIKAKDDEVALLNKLLADTRQSNTAEIEKLKVEYDSRHKSSQESITRELESQKKFLQATDDANAKVTAARDTERETLKHLFDTKQGSLEKEIETRDTEITHMKQLIDDFKKDAEAKNRALQGNADALKDRDRTID
jgi:chromosome segregation ATPase